THAVFEQAPRVQELAAGLGAGTLLMAGLIALVQTDIKRVIAYSTMSQIGYMFLGAGLGAYANAEFHLLTHAFFKALLFLAAGLVIHALAGEQDIRKMGGVGRLMPVTRITFLIGSLALVGVPPFAGFFSKDPIIAATLTRGWYGYLLFAEALASLFAVLLGLAGIGVAWLIYGARQPTAPRITSRVPLWSRSLLEHKFYFDEAYDFAFYRPSVALAKALGRWIEGPIIGGSV